MAYIYDLSDAWAASGTVFTGIKLNVTDTASAAGSLLMDLQVGGVSRFRVKKDGSIGFIVAGGDTVEHVISTSAGGYFTFARGTTIGFALYEPDGYVQTLSSGFFGFSSSSTSAGTPADTRLYRDAANTLAQRNGVNAQAFHLYNSFTDASNYERGFMRFVSNVFEIGTAALGTGVLRNIKIGTTSQGVGVAGGSALSASSVACGSSSATGTFAFAAGQSTASAIGSIALGLSTTASAPVSIAMGQHTVAGLVGQSSLGFSFFATAGDCQISTFVLRATTTSATATEMSALSTSVERMVIRPSTTWAFEITVAARSDGGVDNAMYMYRGMIKRDASNNTTLVGTVDNFYTNETNAAWDVAVTADDTTESLKIMVTGAAATNINWTAKAILTEVGNV